jgi:hypothetical protein
MASLKAAHVVFLQKGWQAVVGGITALLVAGCLTPIEQGFYYTMGSLLSSYTLLDLGLSGLLVQVSARMFASLRFSANGVIRPVKARAEFIAMMVWARRWYAVASLIVLMLLPAGYLYFSQANAQHLVQWQTPWMVIVLAVALSMPAYPFLSVIEGADKVTEVYLVRILHYTFAALLSWGALIAGYGLYALAMMPLSVALTTFVWSHARFGRLLVLCRSNRKLNFEWRTRVWPVHRKVAVVAVANYVFLQCPVPVLFYLSGARAAGCLGLSMVILNVTGAIGMSWFTSVIPYMTRLVAQREIEASKRLFIKEFGRLLLLMCGLYGAILAVIYFRPNAWYVERILPYPEFAMLIGVFMSTQAMSAMGGYFRAHGREVFATASIAASVLALVIASVLAGSYGTFGFMLGLAAVNLLISIPVLLWAWFKWSRR